MAFPSGWGWKVAITADNTKVSSDESNFPYYYDLANLGGEADFWDNVGSVGGDLVVSSDSAGASRLALEVVFINTGTETGEIHFKGSTTDASDKTFYLWWDKAGETQPAAGSAYGRNAVWSNSYNAVWHLQESSGTLAASASGTWNGEYMLALPTATTGKLSGNAQTFVGADTAADYIKFSPNDAGNTHTISFWIKPTASTTVMTRSYFMDTAGGTQRFIIVGAHSDTSSKIGYYTGAAWKTSSAAMTTGSYQYIVYRFNSATSSATIFKNTTKILDDSSWVDGSIDNSTESFGKNTGGDSDSNSLYLSDIDEIRIASVARSDGWITTEYNCQDSNSTFWSTGTPEENTVIVTATETMTQTDDFVFDMTHPLTETITMNDGDVYDITKIFTESVSMSDIIQRTLPTLVLLETITQTDPVALLSFLAELTETITMSENNVNSDLNYGFLRTLTETITSTDALTITQLLTRVMTETVTLTDDEINVLTKLFSEVMSMSDTLTTTLSDLVEFLESFSMTDTLTTSTLTEIIIAVLRDVAIYKAEDVTLRFTITNRTTGSSIDLTAHTVYFLVKNRFDDPDEDAVISKSITTGTSTGVADFELSHIETNIEAGNYFYEVRVVFLSGNIYVFKIGTMLIRQRVLL